MKSTRKQKLARLLALPFLTLIFMLGWLLFIAGSKPKKKPCKTERKGSFVYCAACDFKEFA